MSFIQIIVLLALGLSALAAIPALILFIRRMIKDPVSTWQAFLIMLFSFILNQISFHLAKKYPWELYRYTREQYSGSWAHQTKYIDVYETSMLKFEFLGYLSFLFLPFVFWFIFRKLFNAVPKTSLILLIPFYLFATAYASPSYEFVKKIKLIETRDNF